MVENGEDPLPPPLMRVPLQLPTPKIGGAHGVGFLILPQFSEVNTGVR